jgi:hypothetical protein
MISVKVHDGTHLTSVAITFVYIRSAGFANGNAIPSWRATRMRLRAFFGYLGSEVSKATKSGISRSYDHCTNVVFLQVCKAESAAGTIIEP